MNNVVLIEKCLFMIEVLLVVILLGSVFITSGLFMEEENDAKLYFILISTILLLIYCLISNKGLQKLKDSLKSSILRYGVVFVCMLTTVHGFLQYCGLFISNHVAFPITGTFENPAGFVAVQATMFPFVFTSCFDKEKGIILQLVSIVIAILCFISVLLAGSRTGFLALCSVMAVVLSSREKVVYFFKSHLWIWIPFLIVFLFSSIFLYYLKRDSADGRLFVWNRCIELICEHPLFGYGTNGFHRCYMSAQADFFRMHPESPFDMLADNVTHPFNEFIKLTIQYGLVGLSVVISMIVWIVRKLIKSDRRTKILGLSFLSSLFIMSLFSYPLRYVAVWLLALFAIIPVTIKQGVFLPRFIKYIICSLLFVCMVITLKSMYYDMKWAELSERSIVGQADRMIKYYEGMKNKMRHNPLFLYNYAAELNYLGRNVESADLISECSEKWNDYDVQMLSASNYAFLKDNEKAIHFYDQAHFMIPCRFEPLYGKMMVFISSNDTISALNIANEINEKPIKVRSERVSFIVDQARAFLSNIE